MGASVKPEQDAKSLVLQRLIQGERLADVIAYITSRWPTIPPESLLSAAVEQFDASSRVEVPVLVGWALEAYRELYRQAIEAGDFQAAIKSVKEAVALRRAHVPDDYDQPEPTATTWPGAQVRQDRLSARADGKTSSRRA